MKGTAFFTAQIKQSRQQVLSNLRNRMEKSLHCPMCVAAFQGRGAEDRYRAHYKEKHGKGK